MCSPFSAPPVSAPGGGGGLPSLPSLPAATPPGYFQDNCSMQGRSLSRILGGGGTEIIVK